MKSIIKASQVLISDATLRDGSHAIGHQLTPENVGEYCRLIDDTGVAWVEVGHGNGLGASSFHIGKSLHTDYELLSAARLALTKAELSVHVIPGIASIKRDLIPAIQLGVDIFRVGSHCSEADTTLRHIEFIRENNKKAVGVLMMSHMLDAASLVHQGQLMQNAGAESLVIMDSAGALRMHEVEARLVALTSELEIPIGIHAHNNLGLAVANSIVAVQSGATIVDACAGGFGAGAGNAPIEILIPLLNERGATQINMQEYFRAVDFALEKFIVNRPEISNGSIATGISGLFSGFLKPIELESDRQNVNLYELIEELGKMNLVAGQEDLIIETAVRLKGTKKT